MIIEVQNKFLPEKRYILEVLFNQFLGLEFELRTSDFPQYTIVLPNQKRLIIEDHYFSRVEDFDSLYVPEYLPKNVIRVEHHLVPEKDLIFLYGTDKIDLTKDCICGGDLIASAFFMLTRWEEMIAKNQDAFGRFPDKDSLAFKYQFFDRPVVNEYVEFIWQVLKELGFNGNRKEHRFNAMITHDIDELFRFGNFSRFMRAMVGDIIQRHSFSALKKTISDYSAVRRGVKPDNYDTFGMLMDLSEANNLKSSFYFIPGEPGETDVRYSIHNIKVAQVIHEIVSRGHEAGFHPSYDSYNNEVIFSRELDRLRNICSEIKGGRQHYLRIQVPETFRLWEKHGLKYDSTLGYYQDGGFRAGTCFPYPLYDLKKRTPLKLIERPITVMDVGIKENYLTPESGLARITYFIQKVKKYQGEFVLIWHNSSFNTWYWDEKWTDVYKDTLAQLGK